MHADGTPETKLEQFMLESGLGNMYLLSCYEPEHNLTKAQHDALTETDFNPQENPLSRSVFDQVTHWTRLVD